jgi:hypothetical protein
MMSKLAKVLVVMTVGLAAVFAFAFSKVSVAPAAAVDVCSTASTTPATLTFVNSSGAPVDIYCASWLQGQLPSPFLLEISRMDAAALMVV